MRIVNQNNACARSDRCRETIKIESEQRWGQRHAHMSSAGQRDDGRVRVIARVERDHFVIWRHQGQQCGGDGLSCAGGDQHLTVGIDVDPIEAMLMLSDGFAQLGGTGARRILIDPCGDCLTGSLQHLDRAVGVGKPLAEVDRPGLHGQLGHLGEDGGSEPTVGIEQPGASGNAAPRPRGQGIGEMCSVVDHSPTLDW